MNVCLNGTKKKKGRREGKKNVLRLINFYDLFSERKNKVSPPTFHAHMLNTLHHRFHPR